MFDLAMVDNRDGFESTVGMLAYSQPLCRGRKVSRSCIVQEKKGRQFRGAVVIGENAPHGKTVSHPMLLMAALPEG
jgi:hypothetical protein